MSRAEGPCAALSLALGVLCLPLLARAEGSVASQEAAPSADAAVVIKPSAEPSPSEAPPTPPEAAAAQLPLPTEPTSTELPAPPPEPDPGPSCAFGRLCVGPQLSFGTPHALGVGFLARYRQHVALVGEHAWSSPTLARLSPGIPSQVQVESSLTSLEGRYHPGGGPLFVSLGLGLQWVRSRTHLAGRESASPASDGASPLRSTELEVEAQTRHRVLTLGLGLCGPSNLAIQAGLDLSVVLPLDSPWADLVVRTPSAELVAEAEPRGRVSVARASVQEGLDALLRGGFVAQFRLFRLGWQL